MSGKLGALVLIATLGGCGQISNYSRLEQQMDTALFAGVGDTIVQIETEESMPNIAGKADIFGRTRPTGRILVTFLGLEQGRVALERRNIELQSDATTMNSSPTFISRSSTTTYSGSTYVTGNTPSGSINGTAVSGGTATTNALPIVLPPSGSTTMQMGGRVIRHYLDLNETNEMFVQGYRVLIDEATSSSLKYRIEKIQTN